MSKQQKLACRTKELENKWSPDWNGFDVGQAAGNSSDSFTSHGGKCVRGHV